jgi:molecular chaperone HtpG
MSSAEQSATHSIDTATESRPFEADVAKLLHLMVHAVYSDKDVFLRELISNAADACEKLRYEAIAAPELLGEDAAPRITLAPDAEQQRLVIEDNGIGMSREDLIESLGTIARSGTKAFMERLEAAQGKDGAQLIGQFGIGFYASFMVANRVDVVSRRAGGSEAWTWSSDGQGSFSVAPADPAEAPARGTRVTLHLLDDAKTYSEPHTIERIVKAQSGHVPVPISLITKPGEEPKQITDGAALWTRPKADITKDDYTDFYRGIAGQYDEPALSVHYRAEGRHEYTVLAFVPESRPFDLFDADRKGRMKLYVRRVFITDDADLLPRYLRFVRGLVDSADLPLNVSREMIQDSPILTAIRRGVTSRILSELEKLADSDADAFAKIWDAFGGVLKEGLYEDFERQEQLLKLARFRSTASGEGWRSLKAYAEALKPNQTAIYYLAGDDLARLQASPQLEGFRARGIEVLLLSDPVDSFWVTTSQGFDGKPFKSASQGAADLGLIPKLDTETTPRADQQEAVTNFIAFAKATLAEAVTDVRASDRLTESAVCLVAPDQGPDRQFEKILQSAGRVATAAKPVLEINPTHDLIVALATRHTDNEALRQDAVALLLDEARILDGERPENPKAFSDRLSRVLGRALQ